MTQARQEETRLLFGGRWMPVTKTIIFVEGAVDDLVDSFVSWRGKGVLERTGYPLRVRRVEGNMERLLEQLQPLVTGAGPHRYLFMPTVDPIAPGGPWTCVLDNNWRGSDSGIGSPFSFRGFRVVRVESSPSNLDLRTNKGAYGIHRFGVFWKDPAERHGVAGRSVGVAQFESLRRWDFVDHGDPLPFEDTSRYTARRVRDRFTQEMLIGYAAALGLRPFDEDFYAPDRTAVMVERTDPPVSGAMETDLAGARSGRPIDQVGRPVTWPLR